MLESTRLGKQFRNVLKVLGVAIAVYLALTIKNGITGETDEVVQFDYLATETENINDLTEIEESETHGASSTSGNSTFNKICDKYTNICGKVKRSGSFTDEDKALKFLYVTYLLRKLDTNITRGEDPTDALEAMIIKQQSGRRGNANWDTVTVNLGSMSYDNEFFQVISHEMGHIVDLGGLQGTSRRKSQNFTEFNKEVFAIDDPSIDYYKYSWESEKIRKSGMTKEDFCSGYGMSDPFEDFAECHNLYLNHHDYFHKIALTNSTVKNKYNYFSNLYGGKYINDSEAKYENWGKSYRVWDTTKIREG